MTELSESDLILIRSALLVFEHCCMPVTRLDVLELLGKVNQELERRLTNVQAETR